jgi:hypothetical protein
MDTPNTVYSDIGINSEEVGGQDLVGMLAQELPPAGPGSKRRRWQAMAAEDTANGLVGAAHTELEKFALNATVAPARVLPRPGAG